MTTGSTAGGGALVLAVLLATNAPAAAQTRWTIDPQSSLAWWQMTPHMNHLWATTCPNEPSWRPGDERNAAAIMGGMLRPPSDIDTLHIPLYQRHRVRDVCGDAVSGEVVVADTVAWQGLKGEISVKAERLYTGGEQRDRFMREGILEAQAYPVIRFVIDSLVGGLIRQADTLSGSVAGVFTLHGVSRPMVTQVRIWPEGQRLRVLGKFKIDTYDMVNVYGLSKKALGMGVTLNIWHHLYMGVDLLVRPEALGAK
jgi:polyisoprenoid-binding protein YceI